MMHGNKINKRGKSRPKFYIRRLRIIDGLMGEGKFMSTGSLLQLLYEIRDKPRYIFYCGGFCIIAQGVKIQGLWL